jgi:hypothetical protein
MCASLPLLHFASALPLAHLLARQESRRLTAHFCLLGWHADLVAWLDEVEHRNVIVSCAVLRAVLIMTC